MPNPTVIDIPHTLGRAEASRRMADRVGDLPGRIPGGLATVASSWPAADRMIVEVTVLGQCVTSTLDVGEANVRVSLDLPLALSFMSGAIAAVVRERGEDFLLENKSRA